MRVVDYNTWREQTVLYDEYDALLRYGHCISSSTFIAVPENTGVPDIDFGREVRALKMGPTGSHGKDPFRNKFQTMRPKQVNRGRLK
jgi:hypothetical protein